MASSWAETTVTTSSLVPAAAPRGSVTAAGTEHAESGHWDCSPPSDPKASPAPSLGHRQKGDGPGNEAFSIRKLQRVRGCRELAEVLENGNRMEPAEDAISFASPLCEGAIFNLQ